MIPGILRLNSNTKYGMTSKHSPLYLFNPLDKTLGPCIVGSSESDLSSNVLALIIVEHWETQKLTRGQLIRIIGKCGDLKSEESALLHQYSKFTWKKIKDDAIIIPSDEGYTYVAGISFNVDPVGCIDIDDTIIIGDDGYTYIAIADVASWMIVNPTIFKKALSIGQTLYNNGTVVSPLLPIQELCSLIPGKKRRSIALKFKWNGHSITDISFEKILFVNSMSYTYDTIYKSKYASFLQELTTFIANRQINDPHEWIEQLMIFYNNEAAKVLVKNNQGLLRSQLEPDIEKYEIYHKLGADLEFLANKSAFYTHTSDGGKHWGLSKEYYCHATSPIRRFADIVNQMVLRGDTTPIINIELLNKLGTNAKKYEREIFFLNKILTTKNRSVSGIILNDHRIWIPLWKRIITCKNNSVLGRHGTVKYSLDMDQHTWKRKMIFRFEDINCQE